METYVAPRAGASTAEVAVVDAEWVAAIVAAILGIAVAIVIAVCSECGTMSSVSACLETMRRWINGEEACP